MDDELGYILRSKTRTRILRALSEHDELERSDLVAQSEQSRRTVNRTLAELAESGYLSRSGERFRLTASGDIMVGIVDQWKERAAFLQEYHPFLSHISADELGFDPFLLRGGTLTVATETEPYAALDRLLTLRRKASEILIVSPLIERTGLDQIRDRLSTDEISLEAIIPEAMYSRALNGSHYSKSFKAVVKEPSAAVFVYPGTLPAFFGLFDDIATIAVTEGGLPSVMVENTNERITQQLQEQFDQYRRESSPIDSL